METPNYRLVNGQFVEPKVARVMIPIFGLNLGGCGAEQIERSLQAMPGVLEVYVNRATESAYITYDPSQVSMASLRQNIESTGYDAGRGEALL